MRKESASRISPPTIFGGPAKLCRKSGGDLEQIQMLLGHASIQTTEKYLGMQQNLVEAVNDKLGIVDAEGGQCRDRNPLKDASNGSRMLI